MTLNLIWTAEHCPGPRTRGHPLLRDRPRGVWYEDIAQMGVIKGYPKTLEDWERKRATGLKNLAGQTGATNMRYCRVRRLEVQRLRAEARVKAAAKMEKIVAKIKFEDERAEKAMEAVIQVIELKDENGKHLNSPKDVLAAARLICDFTQPKPVTRNEHVVKAAEDWLESLD